jgi:tRNA(Met) C34 N-acetyltransferase TmcA
LDLQRTDGTSFFTQQFSHKKKRMKEIKKQVTKGVRSADDDDPFELFVASTDIRYTYYKDSHKVLGQTFGMLILQVPKFPRIFSPLGF